MDRGDIEALAGAARGERVSEEPLARVLERLAAVLADLAAALRVEYHGPGVGVEGDPGAYRLVVRPHRLSVSPDVHWGVMICDAAPSAAWRAVWSLPAAGRRRRRAIARALPEFFRGYLLAVRDAGLAESEPGRALAALAQSCRECYETVA